MAWYLCAQNCSKEQILAFANYLYLEQDFERASYEYLRALYMFDNSEKEERSLHLVIGKCFARLDQYCKAKEHLGVTLRSSKWEEMYNEALVNFGFVLFKEGKYSESNSLLANSQVESSDFLRNSITLANYLGLFDGDIALQKIIYYESNNMNFIKELKEHANSLKYLKYKSPLKAGILSALIPGLGRVYSGRTKEGLLSLVSCLSTAYLAYQGFKNDGKSSLKGWLFSSIGCFLYIGNIYGSVLSAKLTNKSVNQSYIKGIEISLSVYLDEN